VENTIPTIYGIHLQNALALQKPLSILAHSTLNERLNIYPNEVIGDGEFPVVRYITIGDGGLRVTTGSDNKPVLKTVPHINTHAGLYNHLPFILRRPNNDLSPTQRNNYRLRRLETHDGTSYVAYYLKKLDLSTVTPSVELRTVTNGVVTSSPYVPSLADLNPTAPNLQPGGVVQTSGNYVAATSKVPLTLLQFDIDEFLEVCNIIYGDTDRAIISEMGLCSGVDRTLVGDFNGTSSGYTECVAVQIVNHIATNIPVKSINSRVDMNFDIGNVEPLLVFGP
jgi:hypothetical protein